MKNYKTTETRIANGTEYDLIKSHRKTLCLEITENLRVLLRTPFNYSGDEADRFISAHSGWIQKKSEIISKKTYNNAPLSFQRCEELKLAAKQILPQKVKYFSNIMHVKPTGIKITSAKKQFGSCNSKNSLCFSYFLMQYPDEAIDYVVVHELAHTVHHNHSKSFYKMIEKYMPDYKEKQKLLKNYNTGANKNDNL